MGDLLLLLEERSNIGCLHTLKEVQRRTTRSHDNFDVFDENFDLSLFTTYLNNCGLQTYFFSNAVSKYKVLLLRR